MTPYTELPVDFCGFLLNLQVSHRDYFLLYLYSVASLFDRTLRKRRFWMQNEKHMRGKGGFMV
jgi:hypothetical protein